MKRLALVLPLVAAALVLAGCTTPQQSVPPTTSTSPASAITFIATQSGPPSQNTTYHFDGPSEVAAGWVKVTLKNNGSEPHQVVFLGLGNESYAAFESSLNASANMSARGTGSKNTSEGSSGNMTVTNTSTPADGEPISMGGVGLVLPGATGSAWIKLPAGTYAAACFIPGANGPHALHGMVKEITAVATNATNASAAPPMGDITVRLIDYRFVISGNLSPGHHVFAVRNDGAQDHESPWVKLAGNHTLKEFMSEALSDPSKAATLITDGGGGAALSPGQVEVFDVNLTAGNYGFFCFEQDTPTSPPHTMLGMYEQVTVK
ncbi:MAG: hypothetical protein ACYDDF_13315 [Thermoplasmatota archaeon]